MSQSTSPERNESESTATPSPSGSPRKRSQQRKYNFNLNSMPLRENKNLFSQIPPSHPRSAPPEAGSEINKVFPCWPKPLRFPGLSTIRPEISSLLSRSGDLSLSRCALDVQHSPPLGAGSAPPNSPVTSDFEDSDTSNLQTDINRFINDFEEILLIKDRSPDFKFKELAACLESIIDADEKANHHQDIMHSRKAEKLFQVKKCFGNLQAQSVGSRRSKKLSELVLKQYLRSHRRRMNGSKQQVQNRKQNASLNLNEEKTDSLSDDLDTRQNSRGYGKQKKSTKNRRSLRSPY